jgi:hypothetical protein
LRATCVAAAALAVFALPGGPRVSAAVYTGYHSYEQLTAALNQLAKSHPKMARLV